MKNGPMIPNGSASQLANSLKGTLERIKHERRRRRPGKGLSAGIAFLERFLTIRAKNYLGCRRATSLDSHESSYT